jgi:hypothetical protein
MKLHRYFNFNPFCSHFAKDLSLEVVVDPLDHFESYKGRNNNVTKIETVGVQPTWPLQEILAVSVAHSKQYLYFTNSEMIAKHMNTSVPISNKKWN